MSIWKDTAIRAFVLFGFVFFSGCMAAQTSGISANHIVLLKSALYASGLYSFVELARFFGVKIPENKEGKSFKPLFFL